MNKTISIFFYYINKYITLSNVALFYLFLSPFFVETFFPFVNIIKAKTILVLSMVIICAFLIKKIIIQDYRINYNKYLLYLLFFFAYAFLTTVVTFNKYSSYSKFLYGDTSLGKLSWICFTLLTMLCCYQLINYKGLLILFKLFYYSFYFSLIGVIINIVYPLSANIESEAITRLNSFMHDSNIYGLYLVLIILLSYTFFLKTNKNDIKQRLFYCITGILAIYILLFTFSRGSFLIFTLIMALLYKVIKIRKNRKFILSFAMILIILFGLQSIKRSKGFAMANNLNTSDFVRISTNLAALNMVKNHFIFGVGYENSRYLIKEYHNKKFPIIDAMVSVHNVYLRVFAELGIIGFLLLITFTILLLRENYSLIQRFDFPQNIIFIFNFCAIFAYIMHGLIYHYYFGRHAYWQIVIMCLLSLKYKDEIVKSSNNYWV